MRVFAIKSPDSGVNFAAALDGLSERNLELSRSATRGISSVTVAHVEGEYFWVVLLAEY